MEATSSEVCASCGEALSEAEIAFGARFCPSCSSLRAEASRSRAPEDDAGVLLLEQEILERVQRELAAGGGDDDTFGAPLYGPGGAALRAETSAAGLVLIDGMGVLVPLPSDASGDDDAVDEVAPDDPATDAGERIE